MQCAERDVRHSEAIVIFFGVVGIGINLMGCATHPTSFMGRRASRPAVRRRPNGSNTTSYERS
jgi:hypothetical protein